MHILQLIEQKFKIQRANFDDDFRLRIHRSISWLKKAKNASDDDTRFIALWIAFNAAYANELTGELAIEKETFIDFITKICELDQNKLLETIIRNNLSESIIFLLENRYTFQPFWHGLRTKTAQERWKKTMKERNQKAIKAIENKNVRGLLVFTFERLYTLRNQIFHGGATYRSSANREQLNASCHILTAITPIIISIMLENPNENAWGRPYYPFVKDDTPTSSFKIQQKNIIYDLPTTQNLIECCLNCKWKNKTIRFKNTGNFFPHSHKGICPECNHRTQYRELNIKEKIYLKLQGAMKKILSNKQ